jgi:ELP3 family radical SAM enzyme/protein acetyltransferase
MDLEDICKVGESNTIKPDMDKLVAIVKEINNDFLAQRITTREEMKSAINLLGRKHKCISAMWKLLSVYRSLASSGEFKHNPQIEKLLITKTVRSLSGVVVITVWTSPEPTYTDCKTGEVRTQKFSCEYNCKYCPNEPGQARSYLGDEPGVRRANKNKFVSTDQFWDRSRAYIQMGHPLDKIELIVSGGTISSYPKEYLVEFFRDQFYAANVAYDKVTGKDIRPARSLEEEQEINQYHSLVKIIGITVETRPDRINKLELEFFRRLGVTRVQIGVQHINDDILNHIGRKCSNAKTIKAIKILKEAGFKVDIHLMPDLPGPPEYTQADMIEQDKQMFDTVINSPDYQADQWKIYPCETVPWTEIENWYADGLYKPYAEITYQDGTNPLFELLIDVKRRVHPWVRLNRVIRDIPNSYIIGGNSNTSMRSDLIAQMTKRGLKCNCIRCREVKSKSVDPADFEIKVREYDASDGKEYFISWEDSENTLLGFLRLRINSANINSFSESSKIPMSKLQASAEYLFPELKGCSLIRELHVYGQVINHNKDNNGVGVQHIGLGKGLINKAIEITKIHGLSKISVISGTGVRNYYMKQGFEAANTYIDEHGEEVKAKGHFLIRDLTKPLNVPLNAPLTLDWNIYIGAFIMVIIAILIYWWFTSV